MTSLASAQFAFAPALASALVHSVWQIALLALAAALALRAMAGAKAATRHNVAMGFLVAMLAVPAVQFLRFWSEPASTLNSGLLPAMTGPELSAANVFVQHSSPLAPFVVLFWIAGITLMLIRHVGSLRKLTAMERGPHELLPPHWQQRVDEMRSALGIARNVAVRLSSDVLSPFAARLLRPVIWLPLSLLTRTPAAQLEALLAHELAHIARKDWLWNGVQCVIESLLFFHPAMWWLSKRIRQEREHACDDLAVTACGDAIALAEALAALECDRHSSVFSNPGLILAANGGSLMQRVTRLLSGPPSRGRWGALAVLGALTVSGVVLITQVGIAGGRFPELQVTGSTAGPLGPGDYREIKAQGLDKQRYYRISLDARGRATEAYEENGEARPLDGNARRWIDRVTKMAAAPPVHPQIPPHPTMEAMPEHQALIAAIAAHPSVVAAIGVPATPTNKPVNGNIRLTGADGDADIHIEMRGPKGTAIVAVEAEMKNRVWDLQQVAVQ
jgi:beta-lactamase regulating signal transducer with metallopeptidase domain